MASLFSKISSIAKVSPTESIGDDNIAISAKDSNPYLAPVVLTARNAYDTLHNTMAPMIQGKKSSLKQIDAWLNGWFDQLEKIKEMYEQLLAKIKSMSSNMDGTLTLDFAKEAWEIVQDTPILRRYMGEANYWYLYDLLGLLATQPGAMSGDMSASIRAMVKAAILALISMTNGLLCIESYLGELQQYWGALYMKMTPIPLLDSIVPNVTCAYWYKPAISSVQNGFSVTNNPPGKGFTPIPVPIPDPVMYVRHPSYRDKFNRADPATWYYDGIPYYMPRTMDMLYMALDYWGSSYTDEYIPIVSNLYNRRDYISGEHPLVTGKTFAQLDTDKYSINGTNVDAVTQKSVKSVSSIFSGVFTDAIVTQMDRWQSAYELARRAMLEYLIAGFEAYGETPSTIGRFVYLQKKNSRNLNVVKFDEWRTTNRVFTDALAMMHDAWQQMVNIVMADSGISQEEAHHKLFDDIMGAFYEAGHEVTGYEGDLENNQIYAVAPSYAPDVITGDDSESELSFIAYKISLNTGTVYHITDYGDIVGTYDIDDVAFAMIPSDYMDVSTYTRRTTAIRGIARCANVSLSGDYSNKVVGSPIETDGETKGTLLSYVFSDGMLSRDVSIVGEMPEALYMHKSCGVIRTKKYWDNGKVLEVDVSPNTFASMFFPDGDVPTSVQADSIPQTFVTLYRSYTGISSDADAELADIVGYSIVKGREAKFPCFSVYGELLSMHSWNYKEMPFEKFNAEYARIKSGSSLYYKKSNPSKVVYYHSSYLSQSRGMQFAVYHEYLDKVYKSKGDDSYTYYVFPCESISVSIIPSGISLGSFLSTDAVGPDGTQYHYIVMRNAFPKCAKYIDPEAWSLMDIIHEMYLLAVNLADLCGDNGERLKRLEEDLNEFHISTPNFIGQLPSNNGQYSLFRLGLFKDYADRIETLVDSVYDLRQEIIRATNTL